MLTKLFRFEDSMTIVAKKFGGEKKGGGIMGVYCE
jgi:hypothetical protein